MCTVNPVIQDCLRMLHETQADMEELSKMNREELIEQEQQIAQMERIQLQVEHLTSRMEFKAVTA